MVVKEKIHCRVCGKLFEPCAYCKAHEDVFRWRNFACSKECASKYIKDTIAYRESLKKGIKDTSVKHSSEKKNVSDDKIPAEKNTTTKRKMNKNSSENVEENKAEIVINNKTEEKVTE